LKYFVGKENIPLAGEIFHRLIKYSIGDLNIPPAGEIFYWD
jgi:hypothetical protein